MKQTKVYQALHIKWYGPTDHKSSRYRVKASAGVKWYAKDFELSPEDNARAVAEQYCKEIGWEYSGLFLGQLANGDYVAVQYAE